jgi:RNA polymerase sigma-70 factor, ECF subfamily
VRRYDSDGIAADAKALARSVKRTPTMTITDEQPDDSVVPDEALVERARGGDGAAFAVLVTRHREAVYTIARNMCATARDAEEAIQQAFLSAWRDLASLPAGARFTTWLYGIAMKTALAQRQRDRRRPSPSLEGFLPAFDREGRLLQGPGRWSELDGSSSEPFEITGLLREALDCVEDEARAAFVLRDLVQLLAEEAAAILRRSPQALRRDAHRVRLMLRGFVLSQGRGHTSSAVR